MIFGGGLVQLVEDPLDHGGREFLRGEAVAATNNGRHRGEGQRFGMLGENSDDVLIERLARGTWFLAAIKNGNRLDGCGQRVDEGGGVEWTIEANLEQADFLALLGHHVNGFFSGFGAGAHDDDDALCIGGAVVVEEVICAAGLRCEAIHDRLHDARDSGVIRAAGFARLEEDVGVLR